MRKSVVVLVTFAMVMSLCVVLGGVATAYDPAPSYPENWTSDNYIPMSHGGQIDISTDANGQIVHLIARNSGSDIVYYRSVDWGSTFTGPTVFDNDPNGCWTPTICADSDSGYVYAAWVRTETNVGWGDSLRMAMSTDQGTNWNTNYWWNIPGDPWDLVKPVIAEGPGFTDFVMAFGMRDEPTMRIERLKWRRWLAGGAIGAGETAVDYSTVNSYITSFWVARNQGEPLDYWFVYSEEDNVATSYIKAIEWVV